MCREARVAVLNKSNRSESSFSSLRHHHHDDQHDVPCDVSISAISLARSKFASPIIISSSRINEIDRRSRSQICYDYYLLKDADREAEEETKTETSKNKKKKKKKMEEIEKSKIETTTTSQQQQQQLIDIYHRRLLYATAAPSSSSSSSLVTSSVDSLCFEHASSFGQDQNKQNQKQNKQDKNDADSTNAFNTCDTYASGIDQFAMKRRELSSKLTISNQSHHHHPHHYYPHHNYHHNHRASSSSSSSTRTFATIIIAIVIFAIFGNNFDYAEAKVKIQQIKVPKYVENGTAASVVLDCVYTMNPDEDRHLVVKWFFNEDPEPIYQWIAEYNSRHVPQRYEGRVNPNYQVPDTVDPWQRFRALQLLRPTVDLNGRFSCHVISIMSQDSAEASMIVYAKTKSIDLSTRRVVRERSAALSRTAASGGGGEPNPDAAAYPYGGGGAQWSSSSAPNHSTIQADSVSAGPHGTWSGSAALSGSGWLKETGSSSSSSSSSSPSSSSASASDSGLTRGPGPGGRAGPATYPLSGPGSAGSVAGPAGPGGAAAAAAAQTEIECSVQNVYPLPELRIYQVSKDGLRPRSLQNARLAENVTKLSNGAFSVSLIAFIDDAELFHAAEQTHGAAAAAAGWTELLPASTYQHYQQQPTYQQQNYPKSAHARSRYHPSTAGTRLRQTAESGAQTQAFRSKHSKKPFAQQQLGLGRPSGGTWSPAGASTIFECLVSQDAISHELRKRTLYSPVYDSNEFETSFAESIYRFHHHFWLFASIVAACLSVSPLL